MILFVRCRHKSICENFGETDFGSCVDNCDVCVNKTKVESDLKKYHFNTEGRSHNGNRNTKTDWEDLDTSDLYGGGRGGINRFVFPYSFNRNLNQIILRYLKYFFKNSYRLELKFSLFPQRGCKFGSES